MTSTDANRLLHDRAFFTTTALLFLASASATVYLCRSMADGGMPMPGGWTMSMSWMRMPGQNWAAAATMFVGSWLLMMFAMMLPALAATLLQYRRAARGDPALGRTTLLIGAGYFLPWGVVGVVAYPLGVGVAAAAMRWPSVSRLVPGATGVLVVLAAIVQLTPWKARQLACCRHLPPAASVPAHRLDTWRRGIRLGSRCTLCCASFTAILLALGVMDLTVMALVTAAITFERVAPSPVRAARVAGVAALATGALVVAGAVLHG